MDELSEMELYNCDWSIVRVKKLRICNLICARVWRDVWYY